MSEKDMRVVGRFRLAVAPQEVVFTGDAKGQLQTVLTLTNQTHDAMAFKVKCTDNSLFRIRPAVGMLNDGQRIQVNITYQPPGDDVEPPTSGLLHFTISHIPHPENASPRSVWAVHAGPPSGEARLPVNFVPENPSASMSVTQ